jgi:hypothetical protein
MLALLLALFLFNSFFRFMKSIFAVAPDSRLQDDNGVLGGEYLLVPGRDCKCIVLGC